MFIILYKNYKKHNDLKKHIKMNFISSSTLLIKKYVDTKKYDKAILYN